MTLTEKYNQAIRKAKNKVLTIKSTGESYKYGDNPYYDMIIENCVYYDLFAGDNPYFERNDYTLR